MEFGLNLRNFMADPVIPVHDQIEETAELLAFGEELGFWGGYAPEHWVSHPSRWVHPMPLLGKFAAATSSIRLITGVLLMPLHNPVDIAEQTTALDQISNGRFILGLGLGYREKELEIVGSNRKERVGRLTESIELMKRLWSGEEVTYRGRYFRATGAQVGITPVQKPHPPIWLACQGPRAAARAARIAGACLVGPYVSWSDHEALAKIYWDELEPDCSSADGFYAGHRCISVAADRETAIRQARESAENTAKLYGGWGMQEKTAVDLGLDKLRNLEEWAAVGSPEECAEFIAEQRDKSRSGYMAFTFLNLPDGISARREYLQHVWEDVLTQVD